MPGSRQPSPGARAQVRGSVIIPAHDEEYGLPILLRQLVGDADDGELDIVVVCNGCSDSTAQVARGFGGSVRVLETPVPSKAEALRLGDAASDVYPRVYVDADVEIDGASIRRLLASLDDRTHAVAPERHMDLDASSRAVALYYAVWQRLPNVRTGLFGRGVIAVSEEGHARVRALPKVMSDDLAYSEAFAPDERRIVEDALVRVRAPRTWRGLVRRRVRVVAGTSQAEEAGVAGRDATTSVSSLLTLVRSEPSLAPAAAVFLGTAVAAKVQVRRLARSGKPVPWLRDDSAGRT